MFPSSVEKAELYLSRVLDQHLSAGLIFKIKDISSNDPGNNNVKTLRVLKDQIEHIRKQFESSLPIEFHGFYSIIN